ncbi:MAG: SDR family NAD(P)-dependent oxidoreductase [Lachnospiraceae bacterium]
MKPFALITGASRGIGRSVAAALASDGCNLILTASGDEAGLADTARLCRKIRNDIRIVMRLCDVGDSRAVSGLYDSLNALGIPGADILVNNAGIGRFELVQDMTDEVWRRIIDVNLSGVFYMCRGALPYMLHNHNGCIINISSYWGISGAAMESAYSASKGGVNAFTLSLASELAFSGIRVNALACEYIDTGMNAGFTDEEIEQVLLTMPSRRVISPDEVGQMVGKLAGSDITGRILSMEEGLALI